MKNPIRKLSWNNPQERKHSLISEEWLIANGLGGYASGTIGGIPTRRYHGLLIAAQPAPLGRINMFNYLSEQILLPEKPPLRLCGLQEAGAEPEIPAAHFLTEFRLEEGLPVWLFKFDSFLLEKRIVLPRMQNSCHISYELLEGESPIRMKLFPALHFRPHDAPVNESFPNEYRFTATGNRYEISGSPDLPTLRMILHGTDAAFTLRGIRMHKIFYRVESRRGYDDTGDLWNPGFFQFELHPGKSATLIASTESWTTIGALDREDVRKTEIKRRRDLLHYAGDYATGEIARELVLEADKFIIIPATRTQDGTRAHAAGTESRTIIAGYHWFTDWGRDTMISLEGLTLATGRHSEAGHILETFAGYMRDGLIPNMFPECENDGVYHTADATLWFFHATDRYIKYTQSYSCLHFLLPVFRQIIEAHLHGTRFGIGIDPKDGLFHQGADGYQLTWMDAKMGDWVVTPRRGKAVELNALWYHALCLMTEWLAKTGDPDGSRSMRLQAEKCRESFNKRFVSDSRNHLFDVVDGENGDDDACRPNQLFAISLPHPVLDQKHWEPVLSVVKEKLLTPFGLRTLSPEHPDYKATYDGDLRNRDAAYHQGTVWPWLLGPYCDAFLKTWPENRAELNHTLASLKNHLNEACVGSVSEIFDAELPFHPRGCIAQAWSVAEFLRIEAKLAGKLPE